MDYSQDSTFVYILIAGIAALAAIVSAAATVAMSRLTSRLAKATEDYARLMREQLDLLRAQAEVPLNVGIAWGTGISTSLVLTVEHPGTTNTLPVTIKKAVLLCKGEDRGKSFEIPSEHSFDDFLKPGKTWKRQVGPQIAARILSAPQPNLFKMIFRTGPKQFFVGSLSVSLQYERAGKLEESSREFSAHKNAVGEIVSFTRIAT